MGLWENIKNIMVISDEDDYENENEEVVERSADKAQDDYSSKKENPARLIKSKSSGYAPSQSSLQVVLVKPDRFDEVTTIADHLNEGKTVVLNLEDSQREISRRIVDFLSGVAYANKGITIIWGMIWGALLFKEAITLKTIIGAVIILIGIYMVVTNNEH